MGIPVSQIPGLQKTGAASPLLGRGAIDAQARATQQLAGAAQQAGSVAEKLAEKKQQADDNQLKHQLMNLYDEIDTQFEADKPGMQTADLVKNRESSYKDLGAELEGKMSPAARARWAEIRDDRVNRSILMTQKEQNSRDIREKRGDAKTQIDNRILQGDYEGALSVLDDMKLPGVMSDAEIKSERARINKAKTENDVNIMLQNDPAKLEEQLKETEKVNGQTTFKNFKSLSNSQRRTMVSAAQNQQKADRTVELSQLKDDTFNSLNEAQLNPDADRIPEEEFVGIMGPSRGKVAHKEYTRRFEAVASTGQILRESKQMNPRAALEHAQEQMNRIKDTPESAPIKKEMAKQIAAEQEMKQRNRATWAAQMDEVKEYDEDLKVFKNEDGSIIEGMEDRFRQTFSERTEMLISLQGLAPQDQEGKQLNPDRYLGLPRGSANIIDLEEAKQKVTVFNDMNSQEFVQAIQQELSLYEKPDHQAILMKDYVEAGLDQRYQVVAALSTISESDAVTLAQAIEQDGENSKLIGSDRSAALKDLLDSNEAMYKFNSAMTGSLGENFGTVAGFSKAVESQAKFFMANSPSLSAEEALDLSMERIIDSQIGTTVINSQAVSISRQNEDGFERTDDEINDIGRRLNVLMERIDVRELDLSPFFDIPEGTEDHIGFVSKQLGRDERDLAQQVRTEITGNGFWRSYPDGQGSYLEVTLAPGESRAIQSKDGKYLFARYSELPEFMRTVKVPAFQGKFTSRPETTRQEKIEPGDDFQPIHQITGGTSSIGSILRNQAALMLSPLIEFQPEVETTNWPTMDPSIEFLDQLP